jgi:hypothetical protein
MIALLITLLFDEQAEMPCSRTRWMAILFLHMRSPLSKHSMIVVACSWCDCLRVENIADEQLERIDACRFERLFVLSQWIKIQIEGIGQQLSIRI